MHILFVVDNNSADIEHFGIMSLSSILRRAGHQVGIVGAVYAKIKKKLRENNSVVLAYSTHYFLAPYFISLNRQVKKEFDVFSIFGGSYPTNYPDMIYEEGVDGVCIGEGDYALLDLLNNLDQGAPINTILNWWIKKDGTIYRNPVRPLIKHLDTLPFADRALFSNHWALFPKFSRMLAITSRGCNYKCSFCTERNIYRRRSVDNVIEELKEVKTNIQAEFVHFADSTFNIGIEWLREFSKRYREEIGLPFFCNVRADLVNRESVTYLKEAGCFSVGMGIETSNDYLRNELLKKGISREQIIAAAAMIHEFNIRLRTYNMLGIPFGTIKDDLETLKLNIQCKPYNARANIILLCKNTDIYNSMVKNLRFKEKLFFKDKYILLRCHSFTPHARHLKNLQKLFGLIVVFPFLMPFTVFLIRLPLSWCYKLLDLFNLLYSTSFQRIQTTMRVEDVYNVLKFMAKGRANKTAL